MANSAYAEPVEVEQWLARRKVGIGSSDAAAVCGLDPYRTPLEVYCSKTDDHEPTGELPADPAMRWGLLLEPAIARAYEIETGRKVIEPEPANHPQLEWMGATADRISCDGERLVEIKTASSRMPGWGESGDPDGVPERIVVQVQHQMAVYGIRLADVACLIDGRDFRIYPVAFNPLAVDSLIEIEAEFWQRVVNRDPPEPDFTHPSTVGLLSKLHRPTGPEISLPDEYAMIAASYVTLGDELKQLEAARDDAKARLIHAMQDAARANVGGYTITRKECERKAHEVKASKYVEFRIKAPKGEMSNV